MPKRLSEVFGVDPRVWQSTGAFDGFIDVDAQLHIDPHLISSSKVPELSGARQRFDAHFENVLKLLSASGRIMDPIFREAVRRLTFHEIPNTGLGYAKEGKRGSAIGYGLAMKLGELGKAIVDAGIRDPDIFALMGLLQDGIGADRISDMTAAIILPHLLKYSARVASELGLPTRDLNYGDSAYAIPAVPVTKEPILLVPTDILRHLPVAESWSDIDTVASHNSALRNRVNEMIGATWKRAARVPKWRLRQALLRNPELIRDLLENYKKKPAVPYDLERDPEMLYQWQPITREAASDFPLKLVVPDRTHGSWTNVVRTILARFKELVELNRLYRLLYNDDGTPRREKAAQLTLFGIADAYCSANNLDLSPETDSGNGPVDFKFSRGYLGRILAEVKLSSSSKILQGFEEQVKAYEEAEQSYHSFYIVIQVDDNLKPINELKARANTLQAEGMKVPEIMFVDARARPSASNR
jgi:hypothetical protein